WAWQPDASKAAAASVEPSTVRGLLVTFVLSSGPPQTGSLGYRASAAAPRSGHLGQDPVQEGGAPVEQGGVLDRLAADPRGHRTRHEHRSHGLLDQRLRV